MDCSANIVNEHIVKFGKTKSLVGVVTVPWTEHRIRRTAVILLNSGIIHRVGPGGLYVNAARRLARCGFIVLRFDLSGIGDSPVRADNVPFIRSSVEETQDAIELLVDNYAVERTLLMGICTGAVVSYRTTLVDERVGGTLLINAQGFIPEATQEISDYINTRKSARYLFGSALFNPRSWSKLFAGRVEYRSIFRALSTRLFNKQSTKSSRSPEVTEIATSLKTLSARGTELFFLYSQGDPGIDELSIILGRDLDGLRTHKHVRYQIVKGADHMFTLLDKQAEFLQLVENWVKEISEEKEATNEQDRAVVSV